MSREIGPDGVRVVSILPRMLGTYGDGGNATVLLRRLSWRGFAVEHLVVEADGAVPTSGDVYLLGGGEDIAQLKALDLLRGGALSQALANGAACLAVCAGLQLLGERLPSSAGTVPGLGVLDLVTDPGEPRLVGEIVVRPTGIDLPTLTGFENHSGRTTLGPGMTALGVTELGTGNGVGGVDGAVVGSVVGTYLHGPVLARNPALADWLLERALDTTLAPLDVDHVEALRAERLAAASRTPALRSGLVERLVGRVRRQVSGG